MENLNSGSDLRVSSWTLATGTEPGRRLVQVVPTRKAPRTAVIISRQPHPPDVLNAVMNGCDFDVVFVESMARAYSQVKRVTPDLVILCLLIDDLDAFNVLSMLKLDSATAGIPVVTYETAREQALAVRMN